MEEKEGNGFIIRDRRTTSSDGASETAKEASTPQPDAARPKSTNTQDREEPKGTAPLPDIDFSSFILSLATSAQVSLGNIPNPQTDLQAQNLPAAKQMIDIIGLLKEKTKGNLNQDEQTLIDSILYNLRMQYVRVVEGKK